MKLSYRKGATAPYHLTMSIEEAVRLQSTLAQVMARAALECPPMSMGDTLTLDCGVHLARIEGGRRTESDHANIAIDVQHVRLP